MGSPFTSRTRARQTEEQKAVSRAAERPHSSIRKLEKPGKCVTIYKMPDPSVTSLEPTYEQIS